MSDVYSVPCNQVSLTSGLLTTGTLIGATTIRAKISEFTVSARGAPVDDSIRSVLQRWTTSAGTAGAAVTPIPADFDAPASITTAGENHSGEPTYTSNEDLWNHNVHVRATHRYVAPPGREIMLPAVATTGVGMQQLALTYTGDSDVGFFFEE
ncbi:MAG: hypothetical protein V3W44_08595 [Dehalococcoidales bacterium]